MKVVDEFRQTMRKRLLFLVIGEGSIVLLLLGIGIAIGLVMDEGMEVLLIFLPLALLIIILVIALGSRMVGKHPVKYFNQCMNQFSASEQQEIERELENAIKIGAVTITNKVVVYQAGLTLRAIPTWDIIWAYQKDQFVYGTRLLNISVVTRDKKTKIIAVGKVSELEIDLLLKALRKAKPNMFIGYDKEKQQMMKNHFDEMVGIADRR